MKANSSTSELHNRRHVRPLSLRRNAALHHSIPGAEETPEGSVAPHVTSKLLIDAREEERARIARELHDGIGQELALLIVNMQFPPDLSGSNAQMNDYLLKIRVQAEKIGTMLRTVSHNLHPPELDYLGLKVALESLCRRFSSGWKIPVHCTCSILSFTPNQSVSLALYRALQEALHNIAKHSQAKSAKVELTTTQSEICLSVTDNGHGFELGRASCGVGLLSMRERIRSVGGTMNVYSRIGLGTRIEFWVPFLMN